MKPLRKYAWRKACCMAMVGAPPVQGAKRVARARPVVPEEPSVKPTETGEQETGLMAAKRRARRRFEERGDG